MRAYYGIYDDVVYELVKHNMRPNCIIDAIPTTHLEKSASMDRKIEKVNITISDFSEYSCTNKEAYEQRLCTLLKDDKVTKIPKLSPIYRVYVDYMLYDDICDIPVDEGILVKEIKSDAVFFPLGLTDDNEHVSRIGLHLNAGFERQYRSKTPYGVMRKNVEKFTLHIKRIYVAQVYMSAFSIEHDDGFSHSHPHHRPFGGHLSIERVSKTSSLNMESVIIFDTLDAGLFFDPIKINMRPNLVSIDLDFFFNDVVLAGSKKEIEKILEENAKEDDEEDPIIPPSIDDDLDDGEDDEDELPSLPDDGDVEEPDKDGEDDSTDNSGGDGGDGEDPIIPPDEDKGDESTDESEESDGEYDENVAKALNKLRH